ncbi:MAG: hypothetical protein EXR72_23225 [Myxococcales bacterium]|nr:hypothetical protein [Myxococcales bacterium]
MIRILLLAACVSGCLHLAGLVPDDEMECRDGCADDRPDGTCPPDCGDCSCCAHHSPMIPQGELHALAPGASCRAQVPQGSDPSSHEPHGIFHVPKLLLA